VLEERTRPGTTHTEIQREIVVCPECYKMLSIGVPLKMLADGKGVRSIPSGDPPVAATVLIPSQGSPDVGGSRATNKIPVDVEESTSGKRPRKKAAVVTPAPVPPSMTKKDVQGTRKPVQSAKPNGKKTKSGKESHQ
jgi:hypothetical protein